METQTEPNWAVPFWTVPIRVVPRSGKAPYETLIETIQHHSFAAFQAQAFPSENADLVFIVMVKSWLHLDNKTW